MADANIKVNDSGPYMVTGSFEVVDGEGNEYESKKAVALCRCGLSSNKPFCDGAHKGEFDNCVRAEQVL
jgi:CDGSH-type Zn-finger protein